MKKNATSGPHIVTAMCLILNQENFKRFQEEIYCLPPNIVNMAIGNHAGGEFLQPKSKKPFMVEDYPMFIPFLDLKKLASHPYSIGGYGWLTFDYAVYVMKWLEIIQPQNVKRGKYEWDNWTRVEVDHFRVEFASRILFHEMNRDRDTSISGKVKQ
ncbi:hypothetical protein AHAS_Ahas17G0300300 [Arachis hypogaea]